MTMLIDREAIVQDIMYNYATVMSSGPFEAYLSPQSDPCGQAMAAYDPEAGEESCLPRPGYKKQNRALLVGLGREGVRF